MGRLHFNHDAIVRMIDIDGSQHISGQGRGFFIRDAGLQRLQFRKWPCNRNRQGTKPRHDAFGVTAAERYMQALRFTIEPSAGEAFERQAPDLRVLIGSLLLCGKALDGGFFIQSVERFHLLQNVSVEPARPFLRVCGERRAGKCQGKRNRVFRTSFRHFHDNSFQG